MSNQKLKRWSKIFLSSCVAVSCVAYLSACDIARNYTKIDRAANADVQDFRDAMAPRPVSETPNKVEQNDARFMPDLMPYMDDVDANTPVMPLVTVAVNQTVPLKDVLFELADQAEIDLQLDPRIRGSIIFTAREKPLDIVIDRIAKIAGLRYDFEDGVLSIELDTPYHETYKIDYLNIVRSVSSSIDTEVSVASGSVGSSGGGGGSLDGNGSLHNVATTSESDFWAELEGNIEQILSIPEARETLLSDTDPEISITPQPIEPISAEELESNGLRPANITVEQVQAQLSAETASEEDVAQSYSLNRQAGLVSILATSRQHEMIERYLDDLKRSVTSQVLIEAKILEVSLKDEFSVGIEWNAVFDDVSLGFTGNLPALTPATNDVYTFSINGNAFDDTLSALSRFGTVRALASPRLTVLNNQSAVLNVAENAVFFELDVETVTNDTSTTTTVDSEIRSVPKGVLINVLPSINLDSQEISMIVRPSITRIDSFVEDPAVAFLNVQGVSSQIPVVSVQEVDSVVSMQSGEVLVMGGLIQDRTTSTQTGVPIASEIPVLGSLFRAQSDSIEKTELVILLKAVIVDRTNAHKTDKELYERFSGDRRPFRL